MDMQAKILAITHARFNEHVQNAVKHEIVHVIASGS
jgi:hypothetical protein